LSRSQKRHTYEKNNKSVSQTKAEAGLGWNKFLSQRGVCDDTD